MTEQLHRLRITHTWMIGYTYSVGYNTTPQRMQRQINQQTAIRQTSNKCVQVWIVSIGLTSQTYGATPRIYWLKTVHSGRDLTRHVGHSSSLQFAPNDASTWTQRVEGITYHLYFAYKLSYIQYSTHLLNISHYHITQILKGWPHQRLRVEVSQHGFSR